MGKSVASSGENLPPVKDVAGLNEVLQQWCSKHNGLGEQARFHAETQGVWAKKASARSIGQTIAKINKQVRDNPTMAAATEPEDEKAGTIQLQPIRSGISANRSLVSPVPLVASLDSTNVTSSWSSAPIYDEDTEIKWTPSHNKFTFQKLVKSKDGSHTFTDMIAYKIALESGAVSDPGADVDASVKFGGTALEVKCKRPASITKPGSYYDNHKRSLRKRQRLADSEEVFDQLDDKKEELVAQERAELAHVDSQLNKYKENFGWHVFRDNLDVECHEKIHDVEVDVDEEAGDSLIVIAQVVKHDVYVAKTKATLAKKPDSSPAKA